jgi:hypothetical protein
MERREYEPIAVGVTMSQYGYWVTEISVSPWQRMSVMICQVGISPDKARALALAAAGPALGRKQGK